MQEESGVQRRSGEGNISNKRVTVTDQAVTAATAITAAAAADVNNKVIRME